jgi:pimeloyl-ACP methyl ester carboxylesterase
LFNNGEPKSTYLDAQGQLTYVQIEKKETLSLPPIKFYKENVNYELAYEKFIGKQISNIGLIKNIDDPMFIDKNVSLGMWKPLDFMNDIGGGVFMTEPYNENKIPILFIHGILGSPTNFRVLIESIDLSKYKPWVFFYASALPLGGVSDHLLYSLKALEMKYKFESIDLISHSAGGLVTRSLILKNYNSGSSCKVNTFITINRPLAGMDSASKGVKYSPIVIPSWRDISSSSKFIKNLHSERLPKSVHYNLIFSHKNNKDGDGVVPMKSELLLSSEYEAEEVIGFESGHVDILTNDEFIAWFNKKLSQ